jgi:hypothetical protein
MLLSLPDSAALMNMRKWLAFWIFAILLVFDTRTAHAEIEIVEGVKYCEPKPELGGKLVFLHLERFVGLITDPANTGSVYEFDLKRKETRVVKSGCPYGEFVPAADGSAFCILFGQTRYGPIGTNLYAFTKWDSRNHISRIDDTPPTRALFASKHLLLEMGIGGSMMLDFSLEQDRMNVLRLPGTSTRAHDSYRFDSDPFFRAVSRNSNVVNIAYSKRSKGLTDGREYADGTYKVDVESGQAEHMDKELGGSSDVLTSSGRYVFFSGDGSRCGRVLVSSPWNSLRTRKEGSSKEVHVLKRFSLLATTQYCLSQVSPCGRFVIVRSSETIALAGDRFGQNRRYYVVDTETGETELLIKDDSSRNRGCFTSGVFWVGEPDSMTKSDPGTAAPRMPQLDTPSATTDGEQDFLEIHVAVLRRFCAEAETRGYRIVFTDVGPESFERDHPELFRKFVGRASAGRVKVVGFSRARIDKESVRDKDNGQKGVVFMFVNIESDGRDGYNVPAMFYDAEGRTHDVSYHAVRTAAGWKAE